MWPWRFELKPHTCIVNASPTISTMLSLWNTKSCLYYGFCFFLAKSVVTMGVLLLSRICTVWKQQICPEGWWDVALQSFLTAYFKRATEVAWMSHRICRALEWFKPHTPYRWTHCYVTGPMGIEVAMPPLTFTTQINSKNLRLSLNNHGISCLYLNVWFWAD